MLDQKLKQIVERAMQGDSDAFQELCEMKARDILYLAIHFMNDRHDGEDAAQEILIYLQKNITNLKSADAFQVWLYRIMRSVCLNMKRKNKKKVVPIEFYAEEVLEDRVEFLPYEFSKDYAKRELLLTVIKELPYKCRMCILLFYYEGLTYREIALILDISIKDVDNTLTKARKLIRRKLEQDKGMNKFLTSTYALVLLPVLTQVLQREAEEIISAEAVRNMLQLCSGNLSGTISAEANPPAVETVSGTGSVIRKTVHEFTLVAGAVIASAVAMKNRNASGKSIHWRI